MYTRKDCRDAVCRYRTIQMDPIFDILSEYPSTHALESQEAEAEAGESPEEAEAAEAEAEGSQEAEAAPEAGEARGSPEEAEAAEAEAGGSQEAEAAPAPTSAGGSPKAAPQPEVASVNSAIDAADTTFAQFASPSLDLDFSDWIMNESFIEQDWLWDILDDENHNGFQETKKLDSDLGVECGSTKNPGTIPSSESNGYLTSNLVHDPVQVNDSFSACPSISQDFQHGRNYINPFDIVKSIINGQSGASLEACLSYWFEQVMCHWFQVRGFPFYISRIKALKWDIYGIKAITEYGGGGKNGIVFCLKCVHEILSQLRCDPSMVHGKYSDDGHDRMVNLDGLVGRIGISGASDKILEIMEYMLARIRAPRPCTGHYTSSVSCYGSKFDNDPTGKQPDHGINHHQYPCQVDSSSSVMHGIHPNQSQTDYSSSSVMLMDGNGINPTMLRDGYLIHPHQAQTQLGYSPSTMFRDRNRVPPSMLRDGKRVLPHQYQTQVDSSSSFMLRDGKVNFNVHKSHVETKQISGIQPFHCCSSSNTFSPTGFPPYEACPTGPIASNLVGFGPFSESPIFFPDTNVNQSQGIDNISTMVGPEATRNLASNQFDESPSNSINMVKGKRSLTWQPLRPNKIHRRSRNREIIPPSINETKRDNSSRSYTFILQKELRKSDLSSAGRIVLPKKEAEAHLPRLEINSGITIQIEDKTLPLIWYLKYRFWLNNKTRMYILEYTGGFVERHGLDVGDYMVLHKDGEGKLVIEAKKMDTRSSSQSCLVNSFSQESQFSAKGDDLSQFSSSR